MALDINQLKAAFAKKSEGNTDSNTGFWDLFFPFYKMDFDQVTVFRFLQDADEDNPLGFIVENKYHELIINGKKKKIACLKMYEGKDAVCPCCIASQRYYDDGDKEMGKRFWRKIDYVAQGIPMTIPFDYPMSDTENPVRMISLSTKLYQKIENEIVKGDLDEMPYDMKSGYDFRIVKTRQGEYANYESSGFARKASPIPSSYIDRIEKYDLSKYRYGKIEREKMEALVEAAITGHEYQDNNNGGDQAVDHGSTGSAALSAKVDAPKPTQSADQVMAAVNGGQAGNAAAGKLSPQEVLDKLRARLNQKT